MEAKSPKLEDEVVVQMGGFRLTATGRFAIMVIVVPAVGVIALARYGLRLRRHVLRFIRLRGGAICREGPIGDIPLFETPRRCARQRTAFHRRCERHSRRCRAAA
jgi:hypothetical protein